MLRTRRLPSPVSLAALTLVAALIPAGFAMTAHADATDAKLAIVVDRDVNDNGSYEADEDKPQPGIKITVTDGDGNEETGTTDDDGRYALEGSSKLTGGRYFVVAEIPKSMPDLKPVPESDSFAPLSTTVDVSSESRTVRMGVVLTQEPKPEPEPEPEPTPDPTDEPAPPERSQEPRYAVGDYVFRDLNRSGTQDQGEPPAARVSVQLLDADGDVLRSKRSSSTGHFVFDDLRAGTYSLRFAGIPKNFRLAPSAAGGDRALDSDPDYTGVTPPFTLGQDEPNVRPATDDDGVDADYINPTIDAGVAPLLFAVTDRVWLDVNGDGLQQVTEPPAAATVVLLSGDDQVLATSPTDAQGSYSFSELPAGAYRLRFEGLPANRAFTMRAAGSDRSVDSDADAVTGRTPEFTLDQGAPGLVPAAEAGVSGVDYVNRSLAAGLVGSYSIGDTVWRDANGDGVLGVGDSGLPGIKVKLKTITNQVIDQTVTKANGRYTFLDLPAGSYQVEFSGLAAGLRFTAQGVGGNPAVDSNADPNGVTSAIVVGDDNPADTTIDAGVTTPANYTASPAAAGGSGTPPVDTSLSETGGVDLSIPLSGLVMVLCGGGLLILEQRRGRLNRAG